MRLMNSAEKNSITISVEPTQLDDVAAGFEIVGREDFSNSTG